MPIAPGARVHSEGIEAILITTKGARCQKRVRRCRRRRIVGCCLSRKRRRQSQSIVIEDCAFRRHVPSITNARRADDAIDFVHGILKQSAFQLTHTTADDGGNPFEWSPAMDLVISASEQDLIEARKYFRQWIKPAETACSPMASAIAGRHRSVSRSMFPPNAALLHAPVGARRTRRPRVVQVLPRGMTRKPTSIGARVSSASPARRRRINSPAILPMS